MVVPYFAEYRAAMRERIGCCNSSKSMSKLSSWLWSPESALNMRIDIASSKCSQLPLRFCNNVFECMYIGPNEGGDSATTRGNVCMIVVRVVGVHKWPPMLGYCGKCDIPSNRNFRTLLLHANLTIHGRQI
eukprot:scaffold156546_cov17-Prasinocladus_malaysianus.AAC.5